ncbi:MAG: Glu-tRNA(Gln) amidotransferase subunit GatD, partial [archaeon]
MKEGERVRVKTKKHTFEGILMPRSELADTDHIVVKLGTGYNIGILKSDIEKSEVLKESEKKASAPKPKFEKGMPKIGIVATGGTISSKVDYKTGGVFPLESAEEMLTSIPELANYVSIDKISQPFQMLGEDMSPAEWGKIAKEVHKELSSAEGVIVTHGTDTLHYTAAALSFMLRGLNKPIAVIGAQRSTDRGSSDDAQNLLCAAHYCLSDIAEVAIVMHGNTNDTYCIASRGTKVRKMHSSRRDAFRPINEAPLAKIFPDGN